MQYFTYLLIVLIVVYMKNNYQKVDSLLGLFLGGLAVIYRVEGTGNQIIVILCAIFVFVRTNYFNEEVTQLRVIAWLFYFCIATYNILIGSTTIDTALHIVYVYNLFKYTILKTGFLSKK